MVNWSGMRSGGYYIKSIQLLEIETLEEYIYIF